MTASADGEAVERYRLRADVEAAVPTPSLVVYPELLYDNISRAVQQVGDAARLRPHFKTHKTIQVVHFLQSFGVTKHKCATIAEAETLAAAGAKDVILAYPLVGPNVGRYRKLREARPDVVFRTIVDDSRSLDSLLDSKGEHEPPLELLVDVNVGMDRTGTAIDDRAADLYRRISSDPRAVPAGLHVYDGHTNQPDAEVRTAQVDRVWSAMQEFVGKLEAEGLSAPRIVVGGTGGFARWGELCRSEPRLECSPGTLFLNDWGYYSKYADLPYFPSIVLLTRVVSKPRTGRMTLDLGSKAVSSDADVAKRVKLLGLPGAEIIGQHEEHLVVETPDADSIEIGTLFYAWPNHVCPTVALHQELLVSEAGDIVDAWPVVARDRRITV
jgi:D-serine deaminase-like pyridoxal phosphate-dependent protein